MIHGNIKRGDYHIINPEGASDRFIGSKIKYSQTVKIDMEKSNTDQVLWWRLVN